jgi:hypothetical protein
MGPATRTHNSVSLRRTSSIPCYTNDIGLFSGLYGPLGYSHVTSRRQLGTSEREHNERGHSESEHKEGRHE